MQLTGTFIAGVYFFFLFTYIWMPPAWLLMRFLTPKKLENRYFKKPHFTSAELALFASFPGSLMRTMIFITACVQPHRGKKRQMIDVPDHVPNWYLTLSNWFFYLSLGHFFIIITFTIGYAIYFLLT